MTTKQKFTVILIDIFYWPLWLFYSACVIDRAWLLGTFKNSSCKPAYCDTSETTINEMLQMYNRNIVPKTDPVFKKILEPSFGGGELLKKIDGYFRGAIIDGIEIDPSFHAMLADWYRRNKSLQRNKIRFWQMDFLKYKGKANVIFMNPPYPQKAFLKHIIHAYDLLEENGAIITLMPESAFNSISLRCLDFRMSFKHSQIMEIKKIGNMVCSYPVPVCMVRIVKPSLEYMRQVNEFTNQIGSMI